MELIKIKGSTYYINAPTNIGVYVFKNKNCILVDTGIDNSQAARIDKILQENNFHPKYIINTHSHTDHCGGNYYFQKNYPGCLIYTSAIEKLYLENPTLHATILFSANPLKGLDKIPKPVNVDFVLENGINKIDDKKFDIFPLSGHTSGQISITTPEKVCFLGDAVFSENIIDKYSFPNLFDIKESIETLQNIKNIDADFFVISHIEKVIEKNELLVLVDKNLANIEMYKEQILELLSQPLTREDLLENIVILNDLSIDFKEYHLLLATVSAFIKYYYEQQLIQYSIENGKLYYFRP